MQKFTDTGGNQWNLNITIFRGRMIFQECDLDIHQLFNKDVLAELANDTIKLVDVLWVCISDQARDRGITFDQLFAGDDAAGVDPLINNDVLANAVERFFDAVVDYLPEKKRMAAKRVVETLRETGNRAEQMVIDKMMQIDPKVEGQKIANEIVSGIFSDTSTS